VDLPPVIPEKERLKESRREKRKGGLFEMGGNILTKWGWEFSNTQQQQFSEKEIRKQTLFNRPRHMEFAPEPFGEGGIFLCLLIRGVDGRNGRRGDGRIKGGDKFFFDALCRRLSN